MTKYLMWQQKAATADCGEIAACSSGTAGTPTASRSSEADDSGVPGAPAFNASVTITGDSGAGLWRSVHIQSIAGQPNLAEWPAGTWSIRLTVASGNANIKWAKIWVCRVSNACGTVSTIGSKGGLGKALDPGGTYLASVTGGASSGATDDTIYLVFGFRNFSASNQTVTLTYDAKEGTPLPIAVPMSAGIAGTATLSATADKQELSGTVTGTGTLFADGYNATQRLSASIAGTATVLATPFLNLLGRATLIGTGAVSGALGNFLHFSANVSGAGILFALAVRIMPDRASDIVARAVSWSIRAAEAVQSKIVARAARWTATGEGVAAEQPAARPVLTEAQVVEAVEAHIVAEEAAAAATVGAVQSEQTGEAVSSGVTEAQNV